MKTDKLKNDIYNIIKNAIEKSQNDLYISQPEQRSKKVQEHMKKVAATYSDSIANAIAEKMSKAMEEFVLSLNIETIGTLKSLTSPAGQVTGKLNKNEFKLS